MSAEPTYGRRHFLKDSIVSIAKTAQEYVAHRDAPIEKASAGTLRENWLRPPGAVTESLFLERCTQCGDCLEACPHEAIRVHPQDGRPIILADEAPCRVCEDFPCIAACETEALLPVDDIRDVRMGRAVLATRLCTADQGCHACVSKCPTEALALNFDSLELVISPERCVGCGVCEYTCKSVNDRTAIMVRPVRHLSSQDV